MFSGKKAALRPMCDALLKLGLALGDTKETPKRLLDTGGFAKKDRITHRFAITAIGEIDVDVKRWLKAAYDRDL